MLATRVGTRSERDAMVVLRDAGVPVPTPATLADRCVAGGGYRFRARSGHNMAFFMLMFFTLRSDVRIHTSTTRIDTRFKESVVSFSRELPTRMSIHMEK